MFIDEVHTVVGAGGGGEGAMDAGNILKPRLARGDLHLVGATTLKEYRTIEKDPALERRFQPVRVGEPSIEDAVLILRGLRPAYEEHHGVRYTDDALRAAVELSDRYLTERVLPDKAIDLIDQAGRAAAPAARREGRRERPSSSGSPTLEADKNAAVSAEHYEEASRIRDAIADVQTAHRRGDRRARGGAGADAVVDEARDRRRDQPGHRHPRQPPDRDRARAPRRRSRTNCTGASSGRTTPSTAVAKAVRRNRTGMGDAHRPVGSFLFLGPDRRRQDRARQGARVVAVRRRAAR